jgi:hypothetical protein
MSKPFRHSFLMSEKKRFQQGVMSVEFALIAMIFITLLLGVLEFGRWIFTMNAATEATRWGARLAVVCSKNDPVIAKKMCSIFGCSDATNISIDYSPTDCDATNCKSVKVSLKNASFTPVLPFMGAAVPLPVFSTTLPRESMDSAGGNNEVCK